MSLEQQVADFEIGVIYDYGRARSIWKEAERASVCEIHVLTSLANAERDIKASLELIQQTRAKLAGSIQIAAE